MLLSEARLYADEVIVAVDRASEDDTWDAARAGADHVFGFRQTLGIGPSRMIGMERARCDWILYLDDDEGMDQLFPELRDDLMAEVSVNHWWLTKKWVTSLQPPRHLNASPWHPEFVLRMMRVDTAAMWKPAAVHSGLRVIGPGGREPRTSILHYERLDHSDAERAAKLQRYADLGSPSANFAHYGPADRRAEAQLDPPPLRGAASRHRPRSAPHRRCRVDQTVIDLDLRPRQPGWAADVEVDMPATAIAGEVITARAQARNSGTLRWVPPMPGSTWPVLGLAYRLYSADGTQLPDQAERAPIGCTTDPGETAFFLARVHVPEEPGKYVVVWQLVSEMEHWFDELGSEPARVTLTVAPKAPRWRRDRRMMRLFAVGAELTRRSSSWLYVRAKRARADFNPPRALPHRTDSESEHR